MKKTSIIKTALLMITLSMLQAAPAFASEGITGYLDHFTEDTISGWAYLETEEAGAPDIQIRITNSATGETVQELNIKPSFKRNDLISAFGEHAVTGFIASVDMHSLPDGSYSASLYHDGGKFANTLYYTKGNSITGADGSAHSLGAFKLTAYCPCRSCSEGWGRQTSSGALAVSSHTVAVDPRVIPIGSKLLINGTVYTAEDVGGAVKGNHIDIYFDTHAETRQFGTRNAEVCILQ